MHPFLKPIAANGKTEMVSPVVDLVLEGRIRQLLYQKQSAREIIDEIRGSTGRIISRFKVYKVKKRMKQERGAIGKEKKKTKKMTKGKVTKLLSMTDKSDPPTQRKMAMKLGVHHSTVQKYLKQNGMKLVRKKKVHQLNEKQIEERKERAPKLMKKIRDNMRSIITSDESLFFRPKSEMPTRRLL